MGERGKPATGTKKRSGGKRTEKVVDDGERLTNKEKEQGRDGG